MVRGLDGKDAVAITEHQALLCWLRAGGRETFIGKQTDIRRVIDHIELEAIQVKNLIHGLANLQYILTVLGDQSPGLDFDRLLRAGRPGAPIRFRFPHRSRAEKIGDVSKAFSVPGEQDRARIQLAVGFDNRDRTSWLVQFRLRHGIGPAEANGIDKIGLTQPKVDGQTRLAEAGGERGRFGGRAQRTGLEPNPGADRVGIGAHRVLPPGITHPRESHSQ